MWNESELRGSERCRLLGILGAVQRRRHQENILAARELLFQERGPRELGNCGNGTCRAERIAKRGTASREDIGLEELREVSVLNVRDQVDLPLCGKGQISQMRIRAEQNVELAGPPVMIDLSQIRCEVQRLESHVVGTMLKECAVEDGAVNRVMMFRMISKQRLGQPLQQKGHSASVAERDPAQFNAYPHRLPYPTQLVVIQHRGRVLAHRPGFECLRNFRQQHLKEISRA